MADSPARQLPPGYAIHQGVPPVAAYRRLRAEAGGLSLKSEQQAAGVARGTYYGCYVVFTPPTSKDVEAGCKSVTDIAPEIVGMGRIIGDGAWYFHIADMAVLPSYQRKGLGDAILDHLLQHIRTHAAEGEEPYVTLFADPPGRKLYAKHGFVESTESLGMVFKTRQA
jgi:GNAT superfamily N-acetyltransferase